MENFEREKEIPIAKPVDLVPKIEFTGTQSRLCRALREKSVELENYYRGAIKVFGDSSNPDRIAQAALSFRELMDKLPRYLDLSFPAHAETLMDCFDRIESIYKGACRNSNCYTDEAWQEGLPMDPHLVQSLGQIGELIQEGREIRPRQCDERARLVRFWDPNLPKTLEEKYEKFWKDMRGFFNSVLHHNRLVDPEEFVLQVEALETFLMDRLCPQTFADHEEIDAIIREGANDA